MSDLEANSAGSLPNKEGHTEQTTVVDGDHEAHVVDIADTYVGVLGRVSKKLEGYGFESRGYQRVLPDERTKQSYWGLCLIWASAGLTISGFTTGLLGPQAFQLTFGQSCGIIWGFGALGSACSAYLATYGKRTGLRALVTSRFAFGYYGAMVMSFLNILTELAFGIIACILGGETLNTMSKGTLPTVWGIIILGIVSWFLATAGFKYVHHYERFAWILPAIVFICLYSLGGSHFTNMPVPVDPAKPLSTATHAGLALSYAAIAFSGGSGWAAVSADYYVYFPVSTPNWKIFLINFLGLWIIPSLATTCGAGFGSALWNNADWAAAYDSSSADLIELVLRPLGAVRFFFLFIMAFSMMSNNVFNLYSVSISMQLFGKGPAKIPRFVYTALITVIMVAISASKYNEVYSIISNFGGIIAYWTIIYTAILLEEFLIFRPRLGWNLEGWNDASALPVGLAAGAAFIVGAVGSIVGMGQTWFYGPIATMIGAAGGDIGTELGFAFAALVYPVFRHFELKHFSR